VSLDLSQTDFPAAVLSTCWTLYKFTELPGLLFDIGHCNGSQPELILLVRQILHKMNDSVSGFKKRNFGYGNAVKIQTALCCVKYVHWIHDSAFSSHNQLYFMQHENVKNICGYTTI
jgi:hypothetical protein